MAETRTILTAEEFLQLCANQEATRYELVRGELVEMPPVGDIHADTAAELTARLRPFVLQHRLGRVFVELGFCLECRPDTVRAPDVSFIRAERLPERLRGGFFPGAPDLAIEVVSPYDRAAELDAKIQEYLEHGTQRVWVVYPLTWTVAVYQPDGTARRYRVDDVLVDDEILPGFSLPLKELFS
jgi:Uma2 family endonuclease